MPEGQSDYVFARFFQGLSGTPENRHAPLAGALIGVSVGGQSKDIMTVSASGALPRIPVQPGQKVLFTFEGLENGSKVAISPTTVQNLIGQQIGEVGAGGWRFTWGALEWWAMTRPHVPPIGEPKAARGVLKHLVKEGETLSYIAQHFDTSVQEIKKNNNLKNDTIYTGQYLYIYGKDPDPMHSEISILKRK